MDFPQCGHVSVVWVGSARCRKDLRRARGGSAMSSVGAVLSALAMSSSFSSVMFPLRRCWTFCLETPSLSARSICVSPFACRMNLTFSLIVILLMSCMVLVYGVQV